MRRRLLPSLFAASLTLNVMYGAVAGILVPAQIARADPGNKEAVLAVVMTVSSLLTVVMRPLWGSATDRTRTRWGHRSPWIVGGAVGAGVVLAALGHASTVMAIALGWIVLQPLLNAVEAPLDAVVADRVPRADRPRASAYYGLGVAVGVAVGAGVTGLFLSQTSVIYLALGLLLVVVMLAFVRLNPQRPDLLSTPTRVPAMSAWRERPFRIVFAGRFALVLGQHVVMGYLLYLVMERTGAGVEEAGRSVTLLTGLHIAAVVVGAVVAGKWVGPARLRWVIGATGIIAVGLAIPLVWPGLGGLVAYAIVAGLGRGLYLTADLALMLDVLPSPADAGRDLSVLGLATILPQTLAPALAGLLLVLSRSNYALLFVVALVAALASALTMSRLSHWSRSP